MSSAGVNTIATGEEAAVADIIAAAEEITDPLDNLVERATADCGAAFAPDVLARLAELKSADRAAFESLRRKLKGAGVRVGELDKAMADEAGEGDDRRAQAEVLLDAASSAELFHTAAGDGYADVTVAAHRETWAVRSRGFKRWLVKMFFAETGGAPCSEALASAISVLEARAAFDGPEREVHLRVGGADGKLYLELCDDDWRAVEVDASGWRVVSDPPVRFRRTAGMLPLPEPVRGGSVDDLRPFLNVHGETDFTLAVAWILAALRDRGPYPILSLAGEQGAAKSSFAAILRSLVDPSSAPLRALPREDRDLFVSAVNAYVLAFDNVSAIPTWVSDTLCRLATGGGFSTRQLYSDSEEVIFDACRPIIINGIEDIVTRPDLADRALLLTLEPILEEDRRPAAELQAAVDTARPRILGALLDCVSRGIRRLPSTRLERLPRMADFATWITAAEPESWKPGTMLDAYLGRLEDSVTAMIDADPVASAIYAKLSSGGTWGTQTAQGLTDALNSERGDSRSIPKDWPTTAKAMAGRLRRIAPLLRKVGIEITFSREAHTRRRLIQIARVDPIPHFFDPEKEGNSSSPPSPPSPDGEKQHGYAIPRGTQSAPVSTSTVPRSSPDRPPIPIMGTQTTSTVPRSSPDRPHLSTGPTAPLRHSSSAGDHGDDGDGSSPHFSASKNEGIAASCDPAGADPVCSSCGHRHSESAECPEAAPEPVAAPAYAEGQRVIHVERGRGIVQGALRNGRRWRIYDLERQVEFLADAVDLRPEVSA